MPTTATLEDFDFDHLEGDAFDVGQQFHEMMLYLSYNLPTGRGLESAMEHLSISRRHALNSIKVQEERDQTAADQLDLELNDPLPTDTPLYWGSDYIPPT